MRFVLFHFISLRAAARERIVELEPEHVFVRVWRQGTLPTPGAIRFISFDCIVGIGKREASRVGSRTNVFIKVLNQGTIPA